MPFRYADAGKTNFGVTKQKISALIDVLSLLPMTNMSIMVNALLNNDFYDHKCVHMVN